jgi:hypothetical protein
LVILVIACILLSPAILRAQDSAGLTSEQLAERTVHRRALEAVIWGMPAVKSQN